MSDTKDMNVVSLKPFYKNGWVFKVSANTFEEGILIVASNFILGYVTCKYFSNHTKAREWINSLAFNNGDITKK